MSPANAHVKDSTDIPSTAVQQIAPPASDTNTPHCADVERGKDQGTDR
jgi:hypothetical protein